MGGKCKIAKSECKSPVSGDAGPPAETLTEGSSKSSKKGKLQIFSSTCQLDIIWAEGSSSHDRKSAS